MCPRRVSNQLEYAWATLYDRYRQLGDIDARLLELEPLVRGAFDAAMELLSDDSGEKLDMANEAQPQFRFYGETAFMFSEAALNCLAETVKETHDPNHAPDHADDFRQLIAWVATSSDPLAVKLQPLLGEMREANVLVLIPRSVMMVHPPAAISPTGYSFVPGERMKLDANRMWPPDSTQDDKDLREALSLEIDVPVELEGYFLATWAVENRAPELGRESRKGLERYWRRRGLRASPGDAIRITRTLIERCGEALGYPVDE